MTPQESRMVEKFFDNQNLLKPGAEVNFVVSLKERMGKYADIRLTPGQLKWLWDIDARLNERGVYWEPMAFTTVSGKQLFHDNLKIADIVIGDIARGLSHVCRFAGQCFEFYSVAQHSIRVSQQVPKEHRLQALLHDATEAYLCDIPTPWKKQLPDYQKLESELWKVIADKFNLAYALAPEVKEADQSVLEAEARELTLIELPEPTAPKQTLMDSRMACQVFLECYETYLKEGS